MNCISVAKTYISKLSESQKYVLFPFYSKGEPLADSPLCGMTLLKTGSMRFRWNEVNELRNKVIKSLENSASAECNTSSIQKTLVPVQLEHTHIVYDVKEACDTNNKIGDGIITVNRCLIPSITVADCVPIFLYDPVKKVFGIVHSGWKGTGIVTDAMELACKNYGSRTEDFCILIGPHIHDCCYIVNEERAAWFSEKFTGECVRPLEDGIKVDWNTGGGKLYRLSLEKANLAAIKKAGVMEHNITLCSDCTCCTKIGNEYIYGSNRRETTAAGSPNKFTVQSAFIFAN
ncbi:MAG: polyphenol oxidase family protein [Treponema sp.]|nr:polyphenol oxidase family protein [Treponema sp.]